ncbi:hypothetical protein LY78DRAFT_401789 [Colletotrichum sublineola]|nr:hypothetical protein LY78DRAFT_401789 [Colletotrichum sublineola]
MCVTGRGNSNTGRSHEGHLIHVLAVDDRNGVNADKHPSARCTLICSDHLQHLLSQGCGARWRSRPSPEPNLLLASVGDGLRQGGCGRGESKGTTMQSVHSRLARQVQKGDGGTHTRRGSAAKFTLVRNPRQWPVTRRLESMGRVGGGSLTWSASKMVAMDLELDLGVLVGHPYSATASNWHPGPH